MLRHAINLAIAAFFALSLIACGDAEGEERGPCYGNGTCNAGLVCLSEICVRDTTTVDAGNDLGGADLGGVDSGVDFGLDMALVDAGTVDAAAETDAGLDAGVDASTVGAACDPWGVRTCASGERCRASVHALVMSASAVGVCQPAGTLGEDALCNFDADDQCAEGFACVHALRYSYEPLSGVCRRLCGRERGSCASPSAICTGGPDAAGVCFDSCDPLASPSSCATSCVPHPVAGGTAFLCMGGLGAAPTGSDCGFYYYTCAPGTLCESFVYRTYACSDYCDTAGPACANGATCTVIQGTVGYCPQPL